ncbi:hemolymph lipopolysaccharide-binding protein-like isoform X1 [Neodiprion virginianus]|uniref:hemolymph lipopolysaccharide-binding protein-like isoform X1 n=1 Tax=Neodiprion virginianus TaxID=2961670 RepID=UPI001EE73E44|nr:hemolymph lipopolysaccharide-binding protein-like isoform X1 [Neodiprion virginianus]
MSCTLMYFLLGWAYFFGAVSIALPVTNSNNSTAIKKKEATQHRADYIYTLGIGAHKLHTEVVSWNDARRNCHDENASLVIVNSIAEAELIGQLINRAGKHNGWVGVHDFYHEGEFVTIHDETLIEAGFEGWVPGEPNDLSQGEDCVNVHTTGKMNDDNCNSKFVYVCELPRVRSSVEMNWVQASPSETQDPAGTTVNPTVHQSAVNIHNIFNFVPVNKCDS